MKSKKHRKHGAFQTGDERIELPLRVLETPVIPFDQSPMNLTTCILYHISQSLSTRIYRKLETFPSILLFRGGVPPRLINPDSAFSFVPSNREETDPSVRGTSDCGWVPGGGRVHEPGRIPGIPWAWLPGGGSGGSFRWIPCSFPSGFSSPVWLSLIHI